MKGSLSRIAGLFLAVCTLAAMDIGAQQESFDGLYMDLGNLFRLSGAKTRSISPENVTGEPGRGGMANDGTGKMAARDLGQKWKVSPSVNIQSKQVFTLASIQGPGAIQHIWMTPTGNWRFSIIRFYWDGEETPSIECPAGDFFAMGWGKYAQISSLPVAVNPGSAFNCYWVMPFRKSCKITMENLDDPVLPDHLCTDGHSRRCCLPAHSVPQVQSSPREAGPCAARRGARAGAICGDLPRLGKPQHRMVGRGRDQVFYGRRCRVSEHLRHRNRGLLLRLIQLREPGDAPVSGVHDALFRACTGFATRQRVPVAAEIRNVPLAHHGSDSV